LNFEEFQEENRESIENISKTKQVTMIKIKGDISPATFNQVYQQAKSLGGNWSPAQRTFVFTVTPRQPPKQHRVKIRATLRLDQLVESPWNRRGFQEDYDLRRLADNIVEEGQHQEIEVRPVGEALELMKSGSPEEIAKALQDRKFEVVIGRRRWKALQLAGKTEIDASIRPDMTDLEACEASYAENEHRKEMSDRDRGQFFKTLLEKFPDIYPSLEAVAARLSSLGHTQITQQRVGQLIAHYEYVERMKEDQQTDSNIETQVSMLPEAVTREIRQRAPPELQPEILRKAAEEDLSVRETKILVEVVTVPEVPVLESLREMQEEAAQKTKIEEAKQDELKITWRDFCPKAAIDDVVYRLGSMSDKKLRRCVIIVLSWCWFTVKCQGLMDQVFQEAESSGFVEKTEERREEQK